MLTPSERWISIIFFSILYNVIYLFVGMLPNPAVPNGFIALNMIVPVVAGYLLGSWSGTLTGAFGVGLNVLINGSPITATAIFPVMIMGYTAGYVGKNRNAFLTSLTIIVGHSINMLYFIRLGLIEAKNENIPLMVMALLSETAFDIVTIIIVITILGNKFFQKERW